jgi:hypothetical protein
MKWRVIITDTESPTGIAPVCEDEEHAKLAESNGMESGGPDWVFSCCPHPQIELHDELFADELAERLSEHDAGWAGA